LPDVASPAVVPNVGAVSRKETTADAASKSGATCSRKLQGVTYEKT
jgi:hypothetical protein